MPLSFEIGFAAFLVLMAGLVVFVLRFAAQQSRQARQGGRPRRASGGSDPSDEPAPPTLVNDADESGDGEEKPDTEGPDPEHEGETGEGGREP